MKKSKKHIFAHVDPENKPQKEVAKNGKEVRKKTDDNIPSFVYRDLGRTGYIIAAFLAILAAIFLIQQKTNWLNPVLKLFGIA